MPVKIVPHLRFENLPDFLMVAQFQKLTQSKAMLAVDDIKDAGQTQCHADLKRAF